MEEMKLSQDHGTFNIDLIRKKDGGKYWCKVSKGSYGKIDPLRMAVTLRPSPYDTVYFTVKAVK